MPTEKIFAPVGLGHDVADVDAALELGLRAGERQPGRRVDIAVRAGAQALGGDDRLGLVVGIELGDPGLDLGLLGRRIGDRRAEVAVARLLERLDHQSGRLARGDDGIGVAFLVDEDGNGAQAAIEDARQRRGTRRAVAFALGHGRLVAGAGHDEDDVALAEMLLQSLGGGHGDRLVAGRLARRVVHRLQDAVRHAAILGFDGDQPVHGFADHVEHDVPPSMFPERIGRLRP